MARTYEKLYDRVLQGRPHGEIASADESLSV
jgi:hypothetical protein